MMEDYLQTEWPDLKVWLTSTTEQWAVIALNGPNARKLLEPLRRGPRHLRTKRSRTWRSPKARSAACRPGCSGSASPASSASRSTSRRATAAPSGRALHEAGQHYGITPYGTETMHVLRAEKGYIIVGQDTDGTVTPDDAGLAWAIGKAKPDFVGKRSLTRPDMLAAGPQAAGRPADRRSQGGAARRAPRSSPIRTSRCR